MKPLALVALSSAVLGACAPGRSAAPAPAPVPVTAPEPAPTPAEMPSTPPAPAAPTAGPAAGAAREAARNWQLLDPATDRVPGTGAERALRELLATRKPARTVVVAVIDGGVDTAHADLRANLWRNPKEVAGNRKDDDNNGYADDVYGWNFIGGRDGRSVNHDTYEVTRLHAQCTGAAAAASALPLPPAERARCAEIAADFNRRRGEAEQQITQVRAIAGALERATPALRRAVGTDSLTVANVTALQATAPDVQRARQLFLQLAASGITPADIAEAQTQLEPQLQYGLNPAFDPRPIVGDAAANLAERRYGNADVTGPDAGHGTHVAGIIGAVRGNGAGIDGVAPAVRIMAVRAVPNGDERDKDVANAIRYAVDNGAHVINMSFGKGYSPGKAAVDAAAKYADERGVLIVHAAGNDGADLSKSPSFPVRRYATGGAAKNWIEVGASSWKGGDSLAAPFSNYGRAEVDVFSPGVDIMSTVPGGGYDRESGTSMAAPVVSGVAALLMAYYPSLTAADVKRIILESATRYATQQVVAPGDGGSVPFAQLSTTGAVVNAYEAVKRAESIR